VAVRTSIQWTDATWNPIRARGDGKVGWHCEKVSPGCAHCYSERLNGRLGNGLSYTKGNRESIELSLDEKILFQPLHWRSSRRVFVCSMTDLFADFILDAWLDRMFAVMALCPQHTFQVLTKRAGRMREYLRNEERPDSVDEAAGSLDACHANLDGRWPLPNVWLGISAEDQERADERLPLLLETPAAVRFVSYEPALGPVEFQANRGWLEPFQETDPMLKRTPRVDWLIIGGESGRGARPMNIAWAREILAQCHAAGIPVFVKQLGRHVLDGPVSEFAGVTVQSCERLRDPKGSDPSEWPVDLRVREWPNERRGG